jgi:hypothetical protein
MLPDTFKKEMDALELKFNTCINNMLKVYDTIKDIPEQKDFALEATKYPFSAFLFNLRKGKLNSRGIGDAINKMSFDYLENIIESAK